MICPKCNQPADVSAQFCGNCGQQLKQAVSAAVPVAVPPALDTVSPEPPAEASAGAAGVPAYAVAQARPSKDGKMLTLAVVVAAFAVPGCLIPIVGLAASIAAIVLAAKHHHAGTGRTVAAIVVGSIGLLLSLATWGYNINQRLKHDSLAPSGSVVTNASVSTGAPVLYRTLLRAGQ